MQHINIRCVTDSQFIAVSSHYRRVPSVPCQRRLEDLLSVRRETGRALAFHINKCSCLLRFKMTDKLCGDTSAAVMLTVAIF